MEYLYEKSREKYYIYLAVVDFKRFHRLFDLSAVFRIEG